MLIKTNATKSRRLRDDQSSEWRPYPIDMSVFLDSLQIALDATGVPYTANRGRYHPTIIAQYALTCWNQYLATNNEYYLKTFLTQGRWLVEHESRIGEDAGGWPISSPHPDTRTEAPWMSALTQGHCISVLLRAYRLTSEPVFLDVARRGVRTFAMDILDGGVSTPLGREDLFFEEVAVYPAAHRFNGFVFGLLGLYEYVELTGDPEIEKLIARSLATMHRLLGEFDDGLWTRSDLLYRRLAHPSDLVIQATLLEVLSAYSGCDHCSLVASRWKSYQRSMRARLHYLIKSHCSSYAHTFLRYARKALFPYSHHTSPVSPRRVCVPITAFPVLGGTRTVLGDVAHLMKDGWQLEYLTQHVGPNPERLVIARFGMTITVPWQFPFVWLYCLAGFWKLISLMRHGAHYHVILPQDGVFTAAFAALAGKLAGVRVVCIDHGNLLRLKSRAYHAELMQSLAPYPWYLRLLERMMYLGYWPSLSLLARVSARFVDHFLIPGVAGDGVEENCERLSIPPGRLTRFASMIDLNDHPVLDSASRASTREKKGIAADAIVIAMVCRLAPEKGIDIAFEAISRALTAVSPSLRERVRVIIAGDGPLRTHIAEDVGRRELNQICVLWGETSPADVTSLLGFSDIFLYTSTRGACFSMSVLEAMASGCAVIASTEPLSNAHLLAEGRGVAVTPGDAEQTSMALVHLLSNRELCCRMGGLAREYIAVHHSPAMFRRALTRVTYWSALDEIFHGEIEGKSY